MGVTFRIGIDLGGTKIEAAAIDPEGSIRVRRRIATPAGDYDGTIAALAGLVAAIESEIGACASVGIGIPGTIVAETGLVKNANSTWLDRPAARPRCRGRARPPGALCQRRQLLCPVGSDRRRGCRLRHRVRGHSRHRGRRRHRDRRASAVGANAIAGEWGHNPLPAPQAGRIARATLLWRPFRLHRDRSCPGPGSPPTIAATAAHDLDRAADRRRRRRRRPRLPGNARSLRRPARPRARQRHQRDRSRRDRPRRRSVHPRHAL